jgi:Group 4 capsule polysaccharide lipoprotein gfcB, YjbF
MRAASVLACVVLLAACSSEGGGDWLMMLKAAQDAWEGSDAAVSLNDAARIPYATLGIRINEGREQILILATDVEGERLWTSSAKVALTTRRGRIVRTAGFGTDLSGYASDQRGVDDWRHRHAYTWSGDFSDLGYYSVSIVCTVEPLGPDPITILGKSFDTIRVDERCRSDALDWTFTNSYWVSAQSGRVWRSRQHFHPKGPAVEIQFLRPPLSQD